MPSRARTIASHRCTDLHGTLRPSRRRSVRAYGYRLRASQPDTCADAGLVKRTDPGSIPRASRREYAMSCQISVAARPRINEVIARNIALQHGIAARRFRRAQSSAGRKRVPEEWKGEAPQTGRKEAHFAPLVADGRQHEKGHGDAEEDHLPCRVQRFDRNDNCGSPPKRPHQPPERTP